MASAARAERQTAKLFKTRDSYQNFALNLGIGTDNALSGSTYGFNPISRNRTLLEWMHRGSWIAGRTVDVVADDMTRSGIDIVCDAPPEDLDGVQECITDTGTWTGIRDSVADARLYGGSIATIMIDGQDYSKPLDPHKIGKGQFRGVRCLDRWMVEPSLNDLVQDQGPYLGMPKFYRVTSDVPGLRNKIIHYTRVIRFIGVRLPYWQQVSENLWGISVIERLYDRMVAFDSATTGAAQLAYKSYLRTFKVKNLRQILAEGGAAEGVLVRYVDMMRRFQSIEGLTLLDGDDEFEPGQATNMTGMSEALLQFGQQLSGATQIPLVRLFGQSPAGLNSTGESDLRTYYDGIAQEQSRSMLFGMKVIVRAASLSCGAALPDKFKIVFRPLWQLSEEQKSEVSAKDTQTTIAAEEAGIITQKTAMMELKQQSKVTGRFTNVTDEDIEAADDELAPRGEDALAQEQEAMAGREDALGRGDEGKNDPKDMRTNDAATYEQWKWLRSFVEYGEGSGPGRKTLETMLRNGWIREKQNGLYEITSKGREEYEKRTNDEENHDQATARRSASAPVSTTRDSLPVSEIAGLPVVIESLRGTIRRGEGWSVVMPADYGYIRRAPSAEGPTEWLDCFVGPARDNAECHVIDAYDPLGEFDEHKVMLAFPNPRAALDCYHAAYNDGRRAGGITTMTPGELREWYTSGDVTRPIQPRNLRLGAREIAIRDTAPPAAAPDRRFYDAISALAAKVDRLASTPPPVAMQNPQPVVNVSLSLDREGKPKTMKTIRTRREKDGSLSAIMTEVDDG